MKSINRQTGLTAISIVILLVVGAFFVLIGLKLAPIYIENYKVRSHLKRIEKDPEMATLSESEIVKRLFRRFDIDDVNNVKQDDVTVEQQGADLIIHIDYEVRTSAIGNLDLVANFSETADISRVAN